MIFENIQHFVHGVMICCSHDRLLGCKYFGAGPDLMMKMGKKSILGGSLMLWSATRQMDGACCNRVAAVSCAAQVCVVYSSLVLLKKRLFAEEEMKRWRWAT